MDRLSKRLYMRQHSNVIRRFQSLKSIERMQENPIFHIEGTNRIIIVTICRIRQRLLSQVWERLVRNTGVKHNYQYDAKVILSRKLAEDELRTELEIEVLYRWITQTKDVDPTGISSTIYLSKKRSAVYNALQQLRLEYYEHGETVLFQGDIPAPEDGHFTIFDGECEVLQFPEGSIQLMKLLYLAKKKRWDESRKLLKTAKVLARIPQHSGFGELSTLTGVKRAATIRTSRKPGSVTQILVLPKQPLLDCLKSRRGDNVQGAAPSEAMDFMRQSGLANRISPKDLVMAAKSMIRRTLVRGEVIFYKGEAVKSLFLVVSGDILLDTSDYMREGVPQPFVHCSADNCYHLSSGSILGDEGVTGLSHSYESTAAVVSDAAVLFEAVGSGMSFLAEKIGALRYCALSYKDKSRWSAPLQLAEEINPYTYFNSLRKAVAYSHPYRGARSDVYDAAVTPNHIIGDVTLVDGQPVPVDDVQTVAAKLAMKVTAGAKSGAAKSNNVAAGSAAAAARIKTQTSNRGGGGAVSSGMADTKAASSIAKGVGAVGVPLPAGASQNAVRDIQGTISFMLQNDANTASGSKNNNNNTAAARGKADHGSSYRNTDPETNGGHTYWLSAAGIHRASEINKIAKRTLEKSMKMHARENILFEMLVKKLHETDPHGKGSAMDEKQFKKYLNEYRHRANEKKKQKVKHLEDARRQMQQITSTRAAMRLFGGVEGTSVSRMPSVDESGLDSENSSTVGSLSIGASKDDIHFTNGRQQHQLPKPYSPPPARSPAAGSRGGSRGGTAGNTGAGAGFAASTAADQLDILGAKINRALNLDSSTAERTVSPVGSKSRPPMLGAIGRVSSYHASYENAAFFQKPRIEQYFTWMDHLNRQKYRSLLNQAQHTMDMDHQVVENIEKHESMGAAAPQPKVTEQSMRELSEIFMRYGLTPSDMNMNWQGQNALSPGPPKGSSSSKTGGGTFNFIGPQVTAVEDIDLSDDDLDDDPHSLAARKRQSAKKRRGSFGSQAGSSVGSAKSTSVVGKRRGSFGNKAVPVLIIPEAAENKVQGYVGQAGKADEEAMQARRGAVILTGDTLDKIAQKKAISSVAGAYRTYSPFTWREDLIKKKEHVLAEKTFHLFLRLSTPDNRRVAVQFYQSVGQHEDDQDQEDQHRPVTPPPSAFAAQTSKPFQNSPPAPAAPAAGKAKQSNASQRIGKSVTTKAAVGTSPMKRISRNSTAHTGDRDSDRAVSPTLKRMAIEHYDQEIADLEASHAEDMRYLEHLQVAFVDDPDAFMEVVLQIQFPVRTAHMPSYQWNTRFMKLNGELSSEVVQKEKLLEYDTSQEPSSKEMKFSKAAMLQSANNIRKQNSQVGKSYEPAAQHEAAIASVMNSKSFIQASFLHASLRNSYLQHSLSAAVSAASGEELISVDSSRHSQANPKSPSRRTPSMLSKIQQAPRPFNQTDSFDLAEDGNGSKNNTQAGVDVTAAAATAATVIGGENGDVNNSITSNNPALSAAVAAAAAVAGDVSGASLASGSQSKVGDTNGSVAATAANSQQEAVASGGGSIGGASQLSGFQIAANQAAAAAMDAVDSVGPILAFKTAEAVPPTAAATTTNFSKTLAALEVTEADSPTVAARKRKMLKASFNSAIAGDATIKRINGLREKLQHGKPDSVALELYETYMNIGANPKRFYEGKRKSNTNSKFRLVEELRQANSYNNNHTGKKKKLLPVGAKGVSMEELRAKFTGQQQHSSTEAAALGKAQSNEDIVNQEVCFFNSLFPNATKQQRHDFAQRIRRRLYNHGEDCDESVHERDDDTSLWSDAADIHNALSQDTAAIAELADKGMTKPGTAATTITTINGIATNGNAAIGKGSEGAAAAAGEYSDLLAWQDYTVKAMQRERRGPKKTLPVLIIKSKGGSTSKRFAVNKSKRWGGGSLIALPAEWEEDPIEGPSSYLEIYKSSPHVRTSIKDRERIKKDIQKRARNEDKSATTSDTLAMGGRSASHRADDDEDDDNGAATATGDTSAATAGNNSNSANGRRKSLTATI